MMWWILGVTITGFFVLGQGAAELLCRREGKRNETQWSKDHNLRIDGEGLPD